MLKPVQMFPHRSPSDMGMHDGSSGLEVVGHGLGAYVDPESEFEFALEEEALPCIERSAEDSEKLGVSIAYLMSGFLEELESFFGEGADPNYYEINKLMLFGPGARGAGYCCPRDGLPGCSYADALATEHTGQATVMLSWCWKYAARTVVSALDRWCAQAGRDPAQTFVWQCALCCNQYRVEEKKALGESEPFEFFEAAFEDRVRSTMHVLALLDTWDEPTYIGRVWCIFELWKAINIEDCTLEVILPETEELRFKDSLRSDGLLAMWKAFEKITIQDAQASVEQDRVNILRLVDPEAESAEELTESARCAALNREVRSRLQAWCVDIAAAHAEAQIDEKNSLGATGLFAGNMLMGASHFERAEAILYAARASMESVGDDSSIAYFTLLRHCAELENHRGRHSDAFELIERVLKGFESNAQSDLADRIHAVLARRREFPKALSVAGDTANFQGQLMSAVELFQQARNAFELSGAAGTYGYTRLLLKLAGCLCRQGKHDDAETVLSACTAVTDNDDCLTPEDGEVQKMFGWCRLSQGRHTEAWEFLSKASETLVDTGASSSVSFGSLQLLMGMCRIEEEAFEEASAHFDQASTVFEDIGATARLEYQSLPFFYGRIHLGEGRPEAAMELFEEAHDAIESAGATQTPEYGRLLLTMGKCSLQQGSSDLALAFFNDAKAAFEASDAEVAFAHLMLLGA